MWKIRYIRINIHCLMKLYCFFPLFRMDTVGMNVLLKLVYMSVLFVWYLWLSAR